MRISVISWVVAVLGLVALAVLSVPKPVANSAANNEQTALIGGDFNLLDSSGKMLSSKTFRGRYMLIYFGYSSCPDICPTSLLLMTSALQQLGPEARKIVPIFISLDPARDTPEKIATYVQNFSPNLVGLTGNKKQIRKVADDYKIYFKKIAVKNSAADYMIDHSGFIYLIDEDGKYLAHFSHKISEQQLVDGLRKNIEEAK
jgi:protein SCO1/2